MIDADWRRDAPPFPYLNRERVSREVDGHQRRSREGPALSPKEAPSLPPPPPSIPPLSPPLTVPESALEERSMVTSGPRR